MSHLDGGLELEQDGLGDEDLASLGAEEANLGLEKLDLLAWAAAPHLQEAVDYGVEVNFVLVRHCRVPLILLALMMARATGKKRGVGSDGQIPSSRPKEENPKKGRREGQSGVIHFWHWMEKEGQKVSAVPKNPECGGNLCFFRGCFGGCGETSATGSQKKPCCARCAWCSKEGFAYLAGLVLTSDRSNEWAVSG